MLQENPGACVLGFSRLAIEVFGLPNLKSFLPDKSAFSLTSGLATNPPSTLPLLIHEVPFLLSTSPPPIISALAMCP